jgi:hypothetical protein
MDKVIIGVVCAMAGCGADVGGNPGLSIERFEVEETPLRSVVRGLGNDGKEVGRLELVHGRFKLSGIFAEGYDDPDVDGRKLDVRVLGQALRWETEGFSPTLHMPAHPAGQWAIGAILDDPHVRPILRQWKIGFGNVEETAPRLSQAITSPGGYQCGDFFIAGTNWKNCSGQVSCTTIFDRTLGLCGGGGNPAGDAWLVYQDAAHWGFAQSMVSQCCPDFPSDPCTTDADCGGDRCVSGTCISPGFFAYKACPDSGPGTESSCGKTGAKATCKACAQYPTENRCSAYLADAGWFDAEAPSGGAEVFNVCYKYPGSSESSVADWARAGHLQPPPPRP